MRNLKEKLITLYKYLSFGNSIRIDASAVCQLQCPVCKTWPKRLGVGSGSLKFEDFEKFVDQYPNFKKIELSNSGEIFLNPFIDEIIKYSYEKGISLSANNGVNLNNISEETIENLVKYRFNSISVSIDGATDNVYKIYRIKGNFNQIINNIKRINYYKTKYSTEFPKLNWQFIIFGHNEDEIPLARRLAKELGMTFRLEFNTDPAYSPVKNKEFVRAQAGFSSQSEYEHEVNTKRNLGVCDSFWLQPQINWDGRLLGCCCNSVPFSANVFKSSLKQGLKSNDYVYAKKMLSGKVGPRKDIPCFYCDVYKWRLAKKCFVRLTDVNIFFKRIFTLLQRLLKF